MTTVLAMRKHAIKLVPTLFPEVFKPRRINGVMGAVFRSHLFLYCVAKAQGCPQ